MVRAGGGVLHQPAAPVPAARGARLDAERWWSGRRIPV